MTRRVSAGSLVLALLGWVAMATIAGQSDDAFRTFRVHPAIQYGSTPARDPVAGLKRRIETGEVRLTADSRTGYLRSILDALDVPVTSQIAVFSPGSLQGALIGPQNPRTLFFNDTVSVGWVRGGFIELAAQDPEQGTVFYVAGRTASASIERGDDECLRCHESPLTRGIPGMRLGSDHRTPLEDRWGGWYVTGDLGSIRHFGNVDIQRLGTSAPPTDPFNWPSLDRRFDTTGYLTPYSDIAALMVFEHQMHAMNLLTRLGWDARIARHDRRQDAAAASLQEQVVEAVDYLLFVDEAPMAAPIRGTSGFTDTFGGTGPRDSRGRSLRQLDLTSRLMRYPCSYMIYAPQFDALPADVKAAVYGRLWAILSGAEQQPKYRRLSLADRRAIVEILIETKQDLPRYFSAAAVRS